MGGEWEVARAEVEKREFRRVMCKINETHNRGDRIGIYLYNFYSDALTCTTTTMMASKCNGERDLLL